jgi:hypothetical protein
MRPAKEIQTRRASGAPLRPFKTLGAKLQESVSRARGGGSAAETNRLEDVRFRSGRQRDFITGQGAL